MCLQSLDKIQELNSPLVAKLVDMTMQPSIILFLDKTEASKEVYQMALYLSSELSHHINFLTVRDPSLLQIRYSLGINEMTRSLPQAVIIFGSQVVSFNKN